MNVKNEMKNVNENYRDKRKDWEKKIGFTLCYRNNLKKLFCLSYFLF